LGNKDVAVKPKKITKNCSLQVQNSGHEEFDGP